MSIIKKKFNYMFSSGLDKLVLLLFNDELTGFIDEDACEQLAHVIENKSSKYSRKEAFECLLRHASKPVSWPSALRILMVFHKLVHMQGALLSTFLINNQLDNFAKFKIEKLPLKTFVHTAIVPHYYKYLQKLSYNYDDFSICFFQNSDFTERLKENDLSVLHFISKIQNILEYLLDILPLLEVSMNQFGKTDLIRQITYFCLTDCYYYYTYISQIISYMISEIFKLQESDAIFLYELYSEHIKITRKLEPIFQLRNQLREFHMKNISFYVIDNELNRKVELYISSVKKSQLKATEKQKPIKKENEQVKAPLKAKLTANLEIDVEAEEDPALLNKPQVSSLAELSNVLIQITTPNFKSVQKKELFKPPVINMKGQRIKSPKIVVISPTGQVQEGMKLLENKKNGNKGYSDFNPFTAKTNFMKLANKEGVFSDSESETSPQPLQNRNGNGYTAVDTATPVRSPNDSMADSYVVPR